MTKKVLDGIKEGISCSAIGVSNNVVESSD